MSSLQERLKALNKKWQTTDPASGGGGGFDLPEGEYEFIIAKPKIIKSSDAPFAKGQLQVDFGCQVVTGECKGKWAFANIFPEQPAAALDTGGTRPAGLAILMRWLTTLGIEIEEFTAAALKNAILQTKDKKFKGKWVPRADGKGGVLFINASSDAADLSMEEIDVGQDDDTTPEVELDLDNATITTDETAATVKDAPTDPFEDDEDFDLGELDGL